MNRKDTQNNIKDVKISFISLYQSCFVVANLNRSTLEKFLIILDHSASTDMVNIKPIQTNSIDLQKNVNAFLSEFGRIIPGLYGFKNFLNQLPLNHFFLVVPGKIEDTEIMIQYFKYLLDFHVRSGINLEFNKRTFDLAEITKEYNLNFFGHQRKVIGSDVLKEIRICRFCNTKYGQTNVYGSLVSFKNKSHAFSEALGNKNVILKDECDACNDRYSRDIEPSLINYLSVFRSVYGLKGKNGKKKLIGKNFELDPDYGLNIRYDRILKDELISEQLKVNLDLNDRYIPQNLYRCLTKFVLSTIDTEDCIYFQKTIEWINCTFDADDLPLISVAQHKDFYKEYPMLIVYQRKRGKESPFMVGEFHYADIVFVFKIPFCSMDTKTLNENDCREYLKIFTKSRASYQWNEMSLVLKTPIEISIDFKINGIKIGENAFVHQKKKLNIDL